MCSTDGNQTNNKFVKPSTISFSQTFHRKTLLEMINVTVWTTFYSYI
jgi:hypothetical protein